MNYKRKDLHDPDNHDGVITHLEPGILECKVKWVLGSLITNKASAGDGIPVELFQILKDDAVKVLHSICQQIWKTAVGTGLKNVSFHSSPKVQQCQITFTLLQNCTHFTCQQSNAQNPAGQASIICELRTSRKTNWIQKRRKNQRSNW